MTQEETGHWVSRLMAEGQLHKFYTSTAWEHLRTQVLCDNKGECQWCKAHGLYVPAVVVHHVQYVRRHPDLALSRNYQYGGVEYTNLIPLCRKCHELAHGSRWSRVPKPPLTQERW